MAEPLQKFDLEERSHAFAMHVRNFVRQVPRTPWNIEYMQQLIRSSGSVGANYIEANEALGKPDFAKQIRISLKESKESSHWLDLIDIGSNLALDQERKRLFNESREFVRIFCAILQKVNAKTIKQMF